MKSNKLFKDDSLVQGKATKIMSMELGNMFKWPTQDGDQSHYNIRKTY